MCAHTYIYDSDRDITIRIFLKMNSLEKPVRVNVSLANVEIYVIKYWQVPTVKGVRGK